MMKFQRAPASIIRSIRQLSLFREWVYLRARNDLPKIRDFTPDERSGDAVDLCLHQVEPNGTSFRLRCREAGQNVEAAFGRPLKGVYVDDYLDPTMANAARPIWSACIGTRLPTYAIIATADRGGVPVTLENLYLPFADADGTALCMLASLHAVSEDGRFDRERVVQQNTDMVPRHFAVIVDPAGTTQAKHTDADDCEIALV